MAATNILDPACHFIVRSVQLTVEEKELLSSILRERLICFEDDAEDLKDYIYLLRLVSNTLDNCRWRGSSLVALSLTEEERSMLFGILDDRISYYTQIGDVEFRKLIKLMIYTKDSLK